MKIAYIGNFQPQHSTETHVAATLEDMGYEVVRLQENDQQAGAVGRDIISRGDIDLFLWTRTWTGHVSDRDLNDLSGAGIPTASLHLDLYVGLKREDGLDTDPFWHTQYVFTPDGDPRSAEVFKAKGINHHYLKPGVFKQESNYGTYRPELAHDVAFVGGGIEYAHPEWPYRRELVQWLMDNYGDMKRIDDMSKGLVTRFGKYGHPQRVMRNQDLNDLYASAKVVVGDTLCLNFNHTYYWSDRVYETIGRGGFIIHPFIEGMQEEFKDGETIVFYRYKDFRQLRRLVDYYITHDDEREKIRKAGHEFVRENATYHNRLRQLLATVFQPVMIDGVDANWTPPLHPTFDVRIKPLKINLGSGADPLDGFTNVDMLDIPEVDVVHNLMNFPYPFDDETASEIRAIDVLEHLDNFTDDKRPAVIAFIEECHRILKPGGELYIQTPGYRAEFAWQDPTHVRPFHPRTFDLWDEDTEYGKTNGYYSTAKFKVRTEELENGNIRTWMVKR